MTATKFAFAFALLLRAPVSAFAPVSLPHVTLSTDKHDAWWIISRAYNDDDDGDVGDDAVAAYGGGGGRSGTQFQKFGVDIDEAVAGYGMTRRNPRLEPIIDLDDDDDRLGGGAPVFRDSGENSGPSTITAPSKSKMAVKKSDERFGFPEVAEQQSHSVLANWTSGGVRTDRDCHIEVALVTQCSVDRLSNLEAQLASWGGKASVAVYVKPAENTPLAADAILDAIRRAKRLAETETPRESFFDVAATLVEGCVTDEPYPINYLRNVALLEAQRQHLRFASSLDKSASLLVDVDFRPSRNLHEMLHTRNAAARILQESKVIVCPAFESTRGTCDTVESLKDLVDRGEAEGFHLSHFPKGHGPTQFDVFWEKSLAVDPSNDGEDWKDALWKESYSIRHQDLFEPYIVMASKDVPLCDERFRGYGLNKISHLASVAAQKNGEYLVLPGVFLVARTHERSESWGKIYGKPDSRENKDRQTALKDLYRDFLENLEEGRPPMVSESTRARQRSILESLP